MSFPKKGKIYTYADYLSWPEDERIELIGGTPSFQAAPSRTLIKRYYLSCTGN